MSDKPKHIVLRDDSGTVDLYLHSDDSLEVIADNYDIRVDVQLDGGQMEKLRAFLGAISVPVIGYLDKDARIEFPGGES